MVRRKGKVTTIVGIMLLLFFVSACSGKEQGNPAGATPTPDNPGMTEEIPFRNGYELVFRNVRIVVDDAVSGVIEQLGSPDDSFKAPNCALDGYIRTYRYGSIEIDTYEQDGEEYISGIYFKDDTVKTEEGAYLFMPKNKLFELYGNDYSEEMGMLVYYKDRMKLKFLIENDEVISIQYASFVTEIKQ